MTDTPENMPISNDQIDPNHSKPLDVHKWSDHPEINKLVVTYGFKSLNLRWVGSPTTKVRVILNGS